MILQLSMTYRPLLDFHPGFPGSLILSLSLVRDISIAWVHGRLLAVSGCTSSVEFQGCVELGDEVLPALLVRHADRRDAFVAHRHVRAEQPPGAVRHAPRRLHPRRVGAAHRVRVHPVAAAQGALTYLCSCRCFLAVALLHLRFRSSSFRSVLFRLPSSVRGFDVHTNQFGARPLQSLPLCCCSVLLRIPYV